MPQTLQCPNCHATLDYDGDPNATTVRCEYCQSTVIVPESLRRGGGAAGAGNQQASALQDALILLRNGRKIEAIKRVREGFDIGLKEAKEMVEALEQSEALHSDAAAARFDVTAYTTPAPPAQAKRSSGGCIVTFAALLVLAVGGIVGFLVMSQATVSGSNSSSGNGNSQVEIIVATVEAITGGELPAVGDIQIGGPVSSRREFGGQEGTGPGFFNDTRHIGVDGSGLIYTMDYEGARVQVFDPDGTFVDTYGLPDSPYVTSMAVDRGGTLYAVVGGVVQRFEARNGAPLDPIGPTDTRWDVVAVGPDGAVYLLSGERLVRLSRDGTVTLDVAEPIPGDPRANFFYDALAADGSGNIFILYEKEILRFDPDGTFVDRFGGEGEGDDQFRTDPYAIAIDGQGRVFVHGFSKVVIFDGSGRYLDQFSLTGAVFSMTFTDANELLVMERNGNRVLTLTLDLAN